VAEAADDSEEDASFDKSEGCITVSNAASGIVGVGGLEVYTGVVVCTEAREVRIDEWAFMEFMEDTLEEAKPEEAEEAEEAWYALVV
jgi:hypothetical protein